MVVNALWPETAAPNPRDPSIRRVSIRVRFDDHEKVDGTWWPERAEAIVEERDARGAIVGRSRNSAAIRSISTEVAAADFAFDPAAGDPRRPFRLPPRDPGLAVEYEVATDVRPIGLPSRRFRAISGGLPELESRAFPPPRL